jgi:putative multiple sugar transport system substrate-binding protein
MPRTRGQIGIAMPTKSSLRWINDGDALKTALEAKGYTVDLQYAEDDIPNQLAQIENMVTKGAKALIIASIDGTTLSAVLQQAADAGVKVIAYDRLIRDSRQCRLLHHLRQLPGRRAPG